MICYRRASDLHPARRQRFIPARKRVLLPYAGEGDQGRICNFLSNRSEKKSVICRCWTCLSPSVRSMVTRTFTAPNPRPRH